MLKHTAVPAIVAAFVLTVGCSDSDNEITVTGPSALFQTMSFVGGPFATVDPAVLTGQPIGFSRCPAEHPLRAPVNLRIQSPGDFSLRLTEVQFRFVDSFNIAAPQVTFPAPALTRQFGTALVQARSARIFPFDFRFGCGTGRTGTIIIIVRTRDSRGHDGVSEVRASVQ